MLRSILVGLLAVSAAAACKGGGDGPPKVEPGVTVGRVVELTGTVTATRGTQTRTLEANGAVSGDDVIKTAQGSHVVIVLAHNNARWDLGPDRSQRVSDSLAWGLARSEQPATAVDETTTAAGRHAERSAATGEAAANTAPQRPESPPANTEPTTGGVEGGDRRRQPFVGGQAPQTATARPPGPPPPPVGGSPGAPGGGPTTPTTPKGKAATTSRKISPKDSGPPDVQPLDALAGESQKVADPLAAAILREREALHACVVAAGVDKVAIVFHVVKGKTTIEVTAGTAKDTACFAKIAARIKLAADVTTTSPLSIDK